MDAVRRDHRRMLRVLLLAVGAGILWTALTLLAQASPSSAAQDDDQGGGLLGLVSGTLNSAAVVADATVVTVTDIATETTRIAVPAVKPVAETLPAPARTVVDRVVTTVPRATGTVTRTADRAVRTVAQKTLDTVGSVAATTPLAPIVGTPGTVGPIVPDVGDIVPVGPARDALGTTPAAEPVTGGEAAAAPSARLVPTRVTIPATPSPSAASPGHLDLLGAARVAGAVVVASVAAALGGPFALAPSELPASAPAGGSGLALAAGLLAVLIAAAPRLSTASLRHPAPGDDALPGAPVFDTDTSPD